MTSLEAGICVVNTGHGLCPDILPSEGKEPCAQNELLSEGPGNRISLVLSPTTYIPVNMIQQTERWSPVEHAGVEGTPQALDYVSRCGVGVSYGDTQACINPPTD